MMSPPDDPRAPAADLPISDAATQDAEEDATQSEASQPLPPPLEGEFALALSGGGYRAAAYHLGVLDVLHRLGRLDMISTLSTISGGTILGACYALSRAQGEPFDVFYERMYRTLERVNVIEQAFNRLNDADRDGREAPSLIRAAADVYATDAFVGDARMSDLFPQTDPQLESSSAPRRNLGRRVVFSATEFASGTAFRFQTGDPRQTYFAGNGSYRVPADVLNQVRLADAMAASSCFPSVFEPIRFPDDFDWGNRTVAEIRAQLPDPFAEPIPLMDGGTFDNQGVNGVLTIYGAPVAQQHFGWLMVSDSSPEKTPPIMPDPVEKNRSGLTIGTLRVGGWITMMIAALSGGLLITDIITEVSDGKWVAIDLLTEVVPLLLVILTVVALIWIRTRYANLQAYASEKASVNLMPVADLLSVDNLAVLVKGRIESLLALTSDIFMKRIRSLVMTSLYTNPTMTAPPEGGDPERTYQRFTFNLIYSTERNRPTLYKKHPHLEPSAGVRTVSERASSVETTLWFKEQPDATWNQLDTVIAAGQVTTCFKILRFLIRWNENVARSAMVASDADGEETQPGKSEQELYDDTLKLWQKVNVGSVDDAMSLVVNTESTDRHGS
jgi:predicted acylesterase/phospholipase RssA